MSNIYDIINISESQLFVISKLKLLEKNDIEQ